MKKYSNLVYRSVNWRSNRSASSDTMFSQRDVSVDMAIQQATMNRKNSKSQIVESDKESSGGLKSSVKDLFFGAVCDIKDSPYKIFKVSSFFRLLLRPISSVKDKERMVLKELESANKDR